jgi:phosphoribosyl 1,2-cyclic phosphodiesterase
LGSFIIDETGTGVSDYRDYVTRNINKTGLPYLVICTHVHFDHVGGNFRFCGANARGNYYFIHSLHSFSTSYQWKFLQKSLGCNGICMGGAARTFSDNVEINSLAMAHRGASVKVIIV